MSLSEDELMDRNQYTTERKRELGRIQAREQNILNYINECCDDPDKLLNVLDDFEIRQMIYKMVKHWANPDIDDGQRMKKTFDEIAMAAKTVADEKFKIEIY